MGEPLLAVSAGTFTRASTASRRTGNHIVSVGTNVLRQEQGGAYLEQAFTNEVTDSEDFSVWAGPSAADVTPDVATAPDSTATRDFVEDVASGAAQQRLMALSGLATTEHVFSFWYRKDSVTSRFPAQVLTNPFTITQINTQTGAIASRVGTPRIEIVEDWGDFWRAVIHITVGAASVDVALRPADGTVWGSFNNAALGGPELWGFQVAEGNFPHSYMATSGAAASKAADVLKWPDTVYPVDVSTGAFSFRVRPDFLHDELTAGGTLIGWDSSNEIRWVHGATGELRWLVGGVNVGALTGITMASRRQELTITTNFLTRQATLSGATAGNGSVALSGVGTWPVSGDLFFGCRSAGVNCASGIYYDLEAI